MKLLYLTEDYLYSKVHNNLLITLLNEDPSLIIYVVSPIRNIGTSGLEDSYLDNPRLIVHTPQIDIPLWRYKYDFWAKQRCKIRLIEKLVPINEIDAVHAATLYTEGYTAFKIHKKYGIPYCVSIRGGDAVFYDVKMPHLWMAANAILRNANKVSCITPCIKMKVLSAWQHRSVKDVIKDSDIVNNGIDNIWLDNIVMSTKTLKNSVNVLYIGRFDSNKNVYRLIQAISLVRNSFDVRLTIVGGIGGNDEEHEIIMKEVIAHPDYIKYLGGIYDKQKLMQVVRQNDVFAMVSHSETFGLVYVECLSQGLPILYSKSTGFDGMYPDGYVGYAVDSYSVGDIADGITKIIDNYTAIRRNICNIDFNRYSWSYTSRKYLEYYNNMGPKKTS